MKMYYCCSAFQKSQASQLKKNILKSTKNNFNLLFFSKATSQQV
jgi:hypothetical protein